MKEHWIWIFIIIVSLSLSFYLFDKSLQYDCSKCSVDFKSKRALNTFQSNVSYPAIELFAGWANGECPVFWDEVNGFMVSKR